MKDDHDDLLCPNCNVSKLQHYARNPDGTLQKTDKGIPIYIRCQESRDYRASRYFDDVLRRTVETGPETTPLWSLVVNGKIQDALIVGDHRIAFNRHLKTFIYNVIEANRKSRFSFLRINIPDVRTCKFGEGERSFSKWDIHYLLVFDLDVEGYDNKADEDHLKELMTYRADRLLPIWFLSNTVTIKNRHIPSEVRAHIQRLPIINVESGKAVTAEAAKSAVKNNSSANAIKILVAPTAANDVSADVIARTQNKKPKSEDPAQTVFALLSSESDYPSMKKNKNKKLKGQQND